MKASQIRPVGNRILVLVNGPHTSAKEGNKIVLPDFVQYPQLECKVISTLKLLECKFRFDEGRDILFNNILIGNKAGVSLGIDEDTGKEMRLITPSDILLILS
jgi:co-chaperonin GroES (HSP10)